MRHEILEYLKEKIELKYGNLERGILISGNGAFGLCFS